MKRISLPRVNSRLENKSPACHKVALAEDKRKSENFQNTETQISDTEYKRAPDIDGVPNKTAPIWTKLSWGLVAILGVLSIVAGYMYFQANARADANMEKYQDAQSEIYQKEDLIQEKDLSLSELEDKVDEQASFLSIQDHILGFLTSDNVITVGMESGTLTEEEWRFLLLEVDDEDVDTRFAQVLLFIMDRADFMATVKFENPQDLDNYGDSDIKYGVIFRDAEDAGLLLIVFPQAQHWALIDTADENEVLMEGDIDSINRKAEEENSILLVTDGDVGYFYFNGYFISELDLSSNVESGKIDIFTSCEDPVSFQDFSIWASSEE